MNPLWVDKYSPKHLGELIGLKKEIKIITTWLKIFIDKKAILNNFKNGILITGPNGSGKSLLAKLIFEHFNIRILEFNASNISSSEIINNKIIAALTSNNIQFYISNTVSSGIIFDEIDSLESRKTFSINDIISLLQYERTHFYKDKKTKKRNQKIKRNKVPMICISKKHISKLKDHVLHINLAPTSDKNMITLINRIIETEKVAIEDAFIQLIIPYCQRDYRRTIYIMENICNYIKSPGYNKSHLYKKILSLNVKDLNASIYSSVHSVFFTPNDIDTCLSYYDYHSNTLSYTLYENFVHYIDVNFKGTYIKKLELCDQYYKYVINFSQIMKKLFGNWHLAKYAAIFSIYSISLNYTLKLKTIKDSFIQNPSVISKYNYRYYNLKAINDISKTIDIDIRNFHIISHILHDILFNHKEYEDLYMIYLKKYGIEYKRFLKIIKLNPVAYPVHISKRLENYVKKKFNKMVV